MKYQIVTYGCQMNKSDSERIAAVLENTGYLPTLKINEADLILINACSVRQSAIDRIHGKIKNFIELKTKNKKLKVVLTGCILKKDKKKFENKVDLILDIKNLSKLPQKLKTANKIKGCLNQKQDYLKILPKYQSSFSAFIPIMTGCNNFCSYCAVPYVKGKEISRPAKEILCEVKNLIKRGYKEIWLLGQNVNSYSSIPFKQLLKKINNIPGNFWIRFTSSHPKDFSDGLIKTMAECKKVTEYLNLPVQSGDNEILKKMNRPYTIEKYKNLVKKIRKKIPGITLSTDIIVGFPKETKKQFQNTIKLFKETKFDMAYISQYSPRTETTAFSMKDNVSHQEKKERERKLTEILKINALENNKKYIGKKVKVLVERKKNTFFIGKTKHYKTVEFKSNKNLTGQFVKVKIIDVLPWRLKGELIS